MSKKKTKKVIVYPDGQTEDVIREDGKYWYTASSQFRKAAFKVKTVERDAAPADDETEE